MLSVTFLGTAAACPTVDRNVSALAVHREGETMLFDCGEGTQRQMMRYGVGFTFREIFLTHYHSDHILGVTGLIRTLGLQDRNEPVVIYGPRPADQIIRGLLNVGIERTKFPVEIVEVRPGDRLARDEYDILVYETDHRADTVGFALAEHIRLGRFNPDRARELGIPEGPLWGKIHKGQPVTLPDGRVVKARGAGRPVPPGTEAGLSGRHPAEPAGHRDGPRGRPLHSRGHVHRGRAGAGPRDRPQHRTPGRRDGSDGGRAPLVLTHISARYSREAPEVLEEAKAVFPETLVARDGMTVDVPFVT